MTQTIICSLPRSGGTLLYHLSPGEKRGFAKKNKHTGVVKSESCLDWMLDRCRNKEAIAIGSYRDIRDIVVSLQAFYNRRSVYTGSIARWTIEEVIEQDLQRIIDNFYRWNEVCSKWYCYETELYGKYDINDTLERIETQTGWIGRKSLYTKTHISSGRGVSRWEEVLTHKHLQAIYEVAGEWLKEYGYKVQ